MKKSKAKIEQPNIGVDQNRINSALLDKGDNRTSRPRSASNAREAKTTEFIDPVELAVNFTQEIMACYSDMANAFERYDAATGLLDRAIRVRS